MAISGAIGNIATDCRHPAMARTPPIMGHCSDVRGHPGAPGGHPWSPAIIITAALSGKLVLVNMSGSQTEEREGIQSCTIVQHGALYIVSQTGPLM